MATVREQALARAFAHAPFLALLAGTRDDLVTAFVEQGAVAALGAATPVSAATGGATEAVLRRARGDVSLLLALADLSGDFGFDATVRALSDFADAACDAALEQAFAERADGAAPAGLAVIALGKLGSRELNYSSDIDPILIFDPDTMPRRARDDPGEAAVRIARRWVELLSARTADGHVLRVDLRLRPTPEVTPIVLPVDAAIGYYESQALAWEQAAFIRARASAGDTALGRRFLDAIQPFIWRRSMDFGQVRRIAGITDRIRDTYAAGQRFGPGFDLKRGRGGIREVEFFAQIQQLIHGGRNPALRPPATRDALAALAQAGHVDAGLAAALDAHYVTLRTIEHRLQMVDDQQTHSLPVDADRLDSVARLHGLGGTGDLLALLEPVVGDVSRAFDGLTGANEAAAGWPHGAEAVESAATQCGFADAAQVARTVAGWRAGMVRVLRTPASQEALEAVLPGLMAVIGRSSRPDAVLVHFDRMIAGLPSAINFFNLLAARPPLLATVVAILDHAPTLAADLAVRSDLIEGLIDASAFADPSDSGDIACAIAAGPTGDVEAMLDHVRRLVGERRFALGVQLVEGVSDPLAVARGYADLADAAVEALTASTIAAFERAHGRIAGGELLILALGRYGGRSLTHASDLDVILLFTGDLLGESDGDRPLGATTYFNRLGQRVIAALSVPTAAGRLYDIDTRLRPQGNQGPLVASLDAFARYQREEAWTWEHMALTRARPVYGSAAARARLQADIDDVLGADRDPAVLMADVVKMRADMARHKPAKGPLDVKLGDGGLVDAEFAIHAQQLRHHRAFDTRLDVALEALVAEGLAPPATVQALALLTRMLVTMRLMAPDGDAPPDDATRQRIATACLGTGATWDALLAQHGAARETMGDWWSSIRDGHVEQPTPDKDE